MRLYSLAVILTALSGTVSAVIGPTADLPIVNRDISPDGFLRSYATCGWCDLNRTLTFAPITSASLANGTFPGPVITGTKVSTPQAFLLPFLESRSHQGANFSINVRNGLTDDTMDRVTSIVRVSLTS